MVAPTRPLAVSVAEASDPQGWLERLSERYPPEDCRRLALALDWAGKVYAGQGLVLTGEPLLPHAVAAASIVADLRLNADAVAATLLFDVPDRLPDGAAQLETRFGPVVARLVDGVARVRRIQALAQVSSRQDENAAAQAEALRKMLIAMVEDIRVVLVALALRTQTMHYLVQCDETMRRTIARETLDVFAPLANRLGVWQIKWELEDLAFRFLEPLTYKKIARLLDERRTDRENFIAEAIERLRDELGRQGVQADLQGRPKHIYSIWKKMQKKRLDFGELYDIRAIRVLVESVADCYSVLGVVHNLWQPVPGEFDDYISHPKGNFYRSLHTVVVGPDDKALEIQIRTFDMHEHAEYGVAAHWRYKEGGEGDRGYEEKIAWLRQLLDWREDLTRQEDVAEAFKSELFNDTIYVLTPQGRVISLPRGSTPIDFAYQVHTDLGHRCRGAKVNGHIVPLGTPLDNGQRVEILAAKEGGPSLDWLHQNYLKSHRAISKVRQWVRQQNLDVAIEAGKAIFEREQARAGAHPNLETLAEHFGHREVDDFFAALGQNEISRLELAHALVPAPAEAELDPDEMVRQSRADTHGEGILIEGVDKLMTLLAKCCKPVPPDPVMGFVTKGRGISIHRTDCTTLKRLSQKAPERLIAADWGSTLGNVFSADIAVEAFDRQSLLRDISDILARARINVTAVNTLSRDNRAQMRFTVEIRDASTLRRVLDQISHVPGVISALRR